MNDLIEYLKSLLTKDELFDTMTYFIRPKDIKTKRKGSSCENIFIRRSTTPHETHSPKDKKNKTTVENKEIVSDEEDGNKKEKKKMKAAKKKDSDNFADFKSESPKIVKKHDDDDDHNNTTFSCQEEGVILIFKRWMKLYQDFYDRKTKLFDVTKIPDIMDNIKYDLLHNKTILNDEAYNLYNKMLLISNFYQPLEYGITVSEKLQIGMSVI